VRSTLIVIAAALAGVLMAWFLFFPSSGAPPAAPAPAAAPAPVASAEAELPARGEPAEKRGPNPVNAAFQDRLKQPDATSAGHQGSAWTVIRRELSSSPLPAAAPLAQEASDLVRDLREARLHADDADFPALARRQAELRQKMAVQNLTNPVIAEQLQRLDALAAAQAAPPPPEPPPAPVEVNPTATPEPGAR
jgi:hypothetical protein